MTVNDVFTKHGWIIHLNQNAGAAEAAEFQSILALADNQEQQTQLSQKKRALCFFWPGWAGLLADRPSRLTGQKFTYYNQTCDLFAIANFLILF